MANNALKTLLKTDLIEMIRLGISDSNQYYLFVSRALPYTDVASTTLVTESDIRPPSIGESSRNVYDTYRNMIFMKRIRPENMKLMIPRIDWTSGDAYTPYSETTDMAGQNYYVMTSEYNVYKCMTSNGASTIMPTGKSTDVVSFQDGYKWKYIYTVDENIIDHVTLDYIPVFVANESHSEQKQVQNLTAPGSIDTVTATTNTSLVFDKIYRLDGYFSDFKSRMRTDLGVIPNIAGSTYVSFTPPNEQGDVSNGYWNDYAIYVRSGPGIGQYFRIVDFKKGGNAGSSYYYANVYPALTRDVLSIAEAENVPANTSKLKIVPYVVIDGDGTDAVVIPNTGTDKYITSLSIVNPGYNYTYAQPRVVTESSSGTLGSAVTTYNSSISTSLSTPKGHGANAIKEFGASDLMILVEIEGTEDGKISTRNDYRQFGIVKSPYLYGGETFAGSEEEVVLKALIKKQPTKNAYGSKAFVAGNHIIGKETRATARILDSESIAESNFHRLYLADVVGNFRFSDDGSKKTRVFFDSTYTGTFVTGDVATQYQGTIGLTLTGSGNIVSYDMNEKQFVVDTTYGSFVSGKTMIFVGGGGHTLSGAKILEVDEEFGEILGQVVLGTTSGSDFLTFGGDEVFGRLASTEFVPTAKQDLGEYNTTTKLTVVNTSQFTDGAIASSSALDGTITQTNPMTLAKVTGTVVDFTVAGGLGFTGIISLNNLTGIFSQTATLTFTPYGTTANTALSTVTINSITNPEIAVGSGELLYIENVRPIQRNIEQSEQFKIVIGF